MEKVVRCPARVLLVPQVVALYFDLRPSSFVLVLSLSVSGLSQAADSVDMHPQWLRHRLRRPIREGVFGDSPWCGGRLMVLGVGFTVVGVGIGQLWYRPCLCGREALGGFAAAFSTVSAPQFREFLVVVW